MKKLLPNSKQEKKIKGIIAELQDSMTFFNDDTTIEDYAKTCILLQYNITDMFKTLLGIRVKG